MVSSQMTPRSANESMGDGCGSMENSFVTFISKIVNFVEDDPSDLSSDLRTTVEHRAKDLNAGMLERENGPSD